MQKKINDLDNARGDASNLLSDAEINDMLVVEQGLEANLDKLQKFHDAKKAKVAAIDA